MNGDWFVGFMTNIMMHIVELVRKPLRSSLKWALSSAYERKLTSLSQCYAPSAVRELTGETEYSLAKHREKYDKEWEKAIGEMFSSYSRHWSHGCVLSWNDFYGLRLNSTYFWLRGRIHITSIY